MTAPEFSRPERLDRIGAGASAATITAEAGERAALAERFGLIAIERLEARFALRRTADAIHAEGHVSAAVVQACVASGDPVPATVEEDFELRFVPESAAGTEEEVEVSPEDCDTVYYTGGTIDLGEAAAETLALALDPFPRSPRATEVLRAAGVVGEDEAGPFGALAGLKAKLEGKQ